MLAAHLASALERNVLEAVHSGADVALGLLDQSLANAVRAVHGDDVARRAAVDDASASSAGNIHDPGNGGAVNTAGGISAECDSAASA